MPKFIVMQRREAPRSCTIYDENHRDVAEVWNVPDDTGKKALKLATLLAAAPELADALVNLMAAVRNSFAYADDRDNCGIELGAADALIALLPGDLE